MAIQTTYSHARANFSSLLDEASLNNELIVIDRKDKEAVAMIALSELESLSETAHLLRSPKNRDRLLTALERSKNTKRKPISIDQLSKKVGLV
jgi:antitoxin YefM